MNKIDLKNSLARSNENRGEQLNIDLAESIANTCDKQSVQLLFDLIEEEDKKVQNDCIKVLFEIGERKPELIVNFLPDFLELQKSKNNRLQWGSLIAINTFVHLKAVEIYNALPIIMRTSINGSVVARDHGVQILMQLCEIEQYKENTFQLFLEIFAMAPENQVANYAEQGLVVVSNDFVKVFYDLIIEKLEDITVSTKVKRLYRVKVELEKRLKLIGK